MHMDDEGKGKFDVDVIVYDLLWVVLQAFRNSIVCFTSIMIVAIGTAFKMPVSSM